MSFCKACGAKVDWYSTPLGKRMPLDPDPHPEGNVRYFSVKNMIAVVEVGSHPVLYRCHFATCPKADEFRKGGKFSRFTPRALRAPPAGRQTTITVKVPQ